MSVEAGFGDKLEYDHGSCQRAAVHGNLKRG